MVLIVLLFFMLGTGSARAEELPEWETGAEEEWNEIEAFLQQRYSGYEDLELPAFSEVVRSIAGGNMEELAHWLKLLLKKEVLWEFYRTFHLAGQIMALGILAAVFAGFSRVFPGEQAAGTAGFMTYLVLVTVLAAAGIESVETAAAALQSQMDFVKVLLPSYCMAVAWAGSAVASAAWMEILLFVLTVMEGLYLTLLLPLTKSFMVLVFAGNMVREEMLQKMTELWKGIILWGARSLPALVVGFQLVQGMVLPVADAVQSSGIQKLLGMIPGIGAGTGAAAKLLLGSGVLIKNSLGAAAMLILGMVSAVPLLKLGMLMFLLRLAAAVLQPAADQRTVEVIAGMAEAQHLLLCLVFYGMIVYVLAIALVCTSTNAAWMAV